MNLLDENIWSYINGETPLRKELREMRNSKIKDASNCDKSYFEKATNFIKKNDFVRVGIYIVAGLLLVYVIGKVTKVFTVTVNEFREFSRAFKN